MCAGELSGQALYNSNDKHLCDRDVGAPLTIKEDTDNSNFPSAYSPDMRYTKQLKENICTSSTLKVDLTDTPLLVSQLDTIALHGLREVSLTLHHSHTYFIHMMLA